jgi:NAD-dependent deacetylase
MEQFYEQLGRGFDMVFSVGTTSIFPYIAAPVIEASRQGVPTVEINPADTAVTSYVDFKLATGAAVSMNRIWEAFREHK